MIFKGSSIPQAFNQSLALKLLILQRTFAQQLYLIQEASCNLLLLTISSPVVTQYFETVIILALSKNVTKWRL